MKKDNFNPKELPLFLSAVSAGFPSQADEEVDQALDLNSYLIPHPTATFFIRVQGNSMEGAGIFSGDLLIVDRSIEPKNGKIIVAVLNGEFTVKRLIKRKNRVFLKAEHSDYSPMEITSEMAFQVWGVVTYVIHAAE
jgi:DNA polymerase V